MKIRKINIKQGLSLNIVGKANANILDLKKDIKNIAVYTNGIIKPLVSKDQILKPLEPLFSDINNSEINFISPCHSRVEDIIYDGRKKIGVVLEVLSEGKADIIDGIRVEGSRYNYNDLSVDNIKRILLNTSLFNNIRKRPFSDIPHPSSIPSSIFVRAIDKDPLPLDLSLLFSDESSFSYYKKGLEVISKLARTFVCIDESLFKALSNNKIIDADSGNDSNIEYDIFSGSYPAGLVGSHIHKLDPISSKNPGKEVWYLDIQALLSIGKLFETSILDFSRIISIAGDINNPTHARVTEGMDLEVLIDKGIIPSDRSEDIVIGSVFNGRSYESIQSVKNKYLSLYDNKVSILKSKKEDKEKLFSWLYPESYKYSFYNVVISKLIRKSFRFSSLMNGKHRPIFPIEGFDKVFPFDTDTLFLLKSLVIKDIDLAKSLGCMELDEEDMGLCSFIDPAKNDYASILRENLNLIKAEGS